jgi:hypothetical protein
LVRLGILSTFFGAMVGAVGLFGWSILTNDLPLVSLQRQSMAVLASLVLSLVSGHFIWQIVLEAEAEE